MPLGSLREQRLQARKKRALRKKVIILVVAIVIFAALVVVYMLGSGSGGNKPATSTSTGEVLLVTSMGNITIELYDDMPITTTNFKRLVSQGVYDNIIFHRVIPDFVVQGGDPTGTGYGDPDIPLIQDEFSANPDHNRNDRGTVAMANSGPNTGSSQFFFNLVNNNDLDNKHPVFGRVVAGMDVVAAIGNVPTDANGRPLQDVRLIDALLIT